MRKPLGRRIYSTRTMYKQLIKNSRASPRKSISALYFAHRQADPDALCSAYALSELFSLLLESRSPSKFKQTVSSKIIAPQGASLSGIGVCKSLNIDFSQEVSAQEIEDADFIFAMDVGESELLQPYLPQIVRSRAKKILVDHHGSAKDGSKDHMNNSYDCEFLDSNATSTCEIVTLGFPADLFDGRISQVLLVGLMYDSQHFAIGNQSTLESALKLLRKGARIDEAKEILRSKPERSETIARFKSAQRLKFKEMKKYFIAETEVSSFQAPVARMLVEIGADVGIAYGEQNGEARVSLRSSQKFLRETAIDLGAILRQISYELSLVGGGHPTAASISGEEKPSVIVEKVISKLESMLP